MAKLTHGTRAAYRSGCKCTPCRAWKASDTAAYRAARRGESPAPAPAKRTRKAPTKEGRPTTPKTGAGTARIPGAIERDLDAALTAIAPTLSPWTKPLMSIALTQAKAADEATPEVVPRIIPQLIATLERLGLETLAASRPMPATKQSTPQLDGVPDDDDADFLAGITRAG